MEILEILENNERELYEEDLDFFETELATGEYTEAYAKRCRKKIRMLREWMRGGDETAEEKDEDVVVPENLVLGLDQLVPTQAHSPFSGMSEEEMIFHTVRRLREGPGYKTEFKKYVKGNEKINEVFVEKHFVFFTPSELGALIMVVEFSEAFLEKYFGAFEKEKIARYQHFSEAFFMKHYSDLDAETVLKHGKNEWKDKAKRSRQLDVFLRLKGINI